MLLISLKELKLDWSRVSSLSADNTNSNFGAHHSLFTNILAKNQNIKKGNCHAHVIHNCIKFSMDALSLDVDLVLVLKICSHFFCLPNLGKNLNPFTNLLIVNGVISLRHMLRLAGFL